MIRVEQRYIAKIVNGRMGEFEIRLPQRERFDDCAVCDAAQRKHDGRSGEPLQFVAKIRITGVDLRADRLVVRRQAFHCVSDTTITQLQVVIGCQRFFMRCETELVQHLVQQNTRMIAGKWPPCSVCTVHPRREAHDQKTRPRIAEWRYRFAIIVRISLLHLVEKQREPRASAAVLVKNIRVH